MGCRVYHVLGLVALGDFSYGCSIPLFVLRESNPVKKPMSDSVYRYLHTYLIFEKSVDTRAPWTAPPVGSTVAHASALLRLFFRDRCTHTQERISEIEVRRDTALGDIAAAATAVDAELPLTLPRASTWPGTAPADVAVAAAEFSASSSFWQECGGNGQ